MPRKLKPYKVDEVKLGREMLEIFFDRDGKKFFATFGMDRAESTDLNKAKALAIKLLEKPRDYAWEQMILVKRVRQGERHSFGDGNDWLSASVEFDFFRLDRASSPTNKRVRYQRLHPVDFNDGHVGEQPWWDKATRKEHAASMRAKREKNEHLDTYERGYPEHATVELPYSDALWEKLIAIKATIDAARKKLYELTRGENLVEKLLGAGGRPPPMLPPMLPPARRPTRAEVLEARRAASSGA